MPKTIKRQLLIEKIGHLTEGLCGGYLFVFDQPHVNGRIYTKNAFDASIFIQYRRIR